MKHIRFFETEAEMTAFLAENPTYGVLCMNGENNKVKIVAGQDEPTSPYVAVDLGLSVKWANMNIGATKESEKGLYFAWGDTEGFAASEVSGKFSDSWYATRPGASLTSDITPDGGHDAARANMGGDWRMPTQTEMNELKNYGNRTWTTIDGMTGYKIVNSSDSSKYIFLPAAGYGGNGSVYNVGFSGYYWSSTFLDSDGSYFLDFYSGFFYVGTYSRCSGFSVRGVQ